MTAFGDEMSRRIARVIFVRAMAGDSQATIFWLKAKIARTKDEDAIQTAARTLWTPGTRLRFLDRTRALGGTVRWCVGRCDDCPDGDIYRIAFDEGWEAEMCGSIFVPWAPRNREDTDD